MLTGGVSRPCFSCVGDPKNTNKSNNSQTKTPAAAENRPRSATTPQTTKNVKPVGTGQGYAFVMEAVKKNMVLAQKLESEVGETTQMSIRVGVNTDSFLIQPKLNNSKIKTNTGQKYYYEEIKNQKFQISSPSFFQVNSDQISKMTEIILSLIDGIDKNLLVDAYAGVGTFGIMLNKKFKKIVGIEQSYSAVIDAKSNIKNLDNYEMIIGNSEEIISAIKPKIDLLILDPSRKGCDEKLIQNLILEPVKNIIYISCDPKTLARDLSMLTQNCIYEIRSINPIDLFPNTHHVESISLLTLKK